MLCNIVRTQLPNIIAVPFKYLLDSKNYDIHEILLHAKTTSLIWFIFWVMLHPV